MSQESHYKQHNSFEGNARANKNTDRYFVFANGVTKINIRNYRGNVLAGPLRRGKSAIKNMDKLEVQSGVENIFSVLSQFQRLN